LKIERKIICSIACRPNYIDNIVHDWLDVFYYTFPDTKKNPEMCTRKLGEECPGWLNVMPCTKGNDTFVQSN
jgi:hypothetical protein